MNSEQRQIGNTGLTLGILGFGCAPLGNLYHAVTDRDAAATLDAAWASGFRYYDTAPHYGQGLSERRVGDMLRSKQGHHYVLSSKVGRLLKPAGYAGERHCYRSPMPFDIHYDYSYDGILRSHEDSLQRLGLDRIDILFMHDIGTFTHGDANEALFATAMNGGYRAMDELRRQGLVKAIGLGVNEYEVCERALEHGDWDCFLLAGRYTLLEQESLNTFLPKCRQRNCSVIIGGVYNSGILATGAKGADRPRYNYEAPPQPVIDKVKQLEALCDDYQTPMAALALQFPLAHPCVASVIPGMNSPGQVSQAIESLETTVPAELWQSLRAHGLMHDDAPLPGGV